MNICGSFGSLHPWYCYWWLQQRSLPVGEWRVWLSWEGRRWWRWRCGRQRWRLPWGGGWCSMAVLGGGARAVVALAGGYEKQSVQQAEAKCPTATSTRIYRPHPEQSLQSLGATHSLPPDLNRLGAWLPGKHMIRRCEHKGSVAGRRVEWCVRGSVRACVVVQHTRD